MTNKQKLLLIASPANAETIEGIRFREENRTWLRESQYVNKLIKGKENLTIETLSKLQNILKIPLLAGFQ
jgi:hypothetical protein